MSGPVGESSQAVLEERDWKRIGASLERHLSDEWDEPELAISDVQSFGDGHAGFTYTVRVLSERINDTAVLRLSPPGARIAGPADVGRQGHIMRALRTTAVPVPSVFASSSQPVVDGRSFALLELVDGVGWQAAVKTCSSGAIARAALDVWNAMRAVGPDGYGIADDLPIAPADDVRRWSALLPRCPGRVREPAQLLLAELLEAPSNPGDVTLVHGDFHLGNMLFNENRVVALLDWEIASVGHPLTDLACLVVATVRRKYQNEPNPTGSLDIAPTTLIDMAALSAAERDSLDWHVAAACFKYAAILGYNWTLHATGRRPDPLYDELHETMRGLVDDGRAILSGRVADYGQLLAEHAPRDDNLRAHPPSAPAS